MRALAFVVAALVVRSPAQQMVRDIQTFTDDPGSAPGPFVSFGGAVVFAASTAATGRELWILPDGSARAQLPVELAPGAADADPEHVVVAGGRLFFAACDGTSPGLYVSDGTVGGTTRLASLTLRPESAGPQVFALGNGVLAVADDGARGPELWFSDGTVAGTRLVRELEPAAAGVELRAATASGAELYVALAAPHTAPRRSLLVRSDGTAAGTAIVTRSDQGGPDLGAAMVAANGVVYFAGSPAGQDDFELWRSDGSAAGTYLVLDLDPGRGSFLGDLQPFGPGVAFLAHAASYGDEPIVSDGTALGTQIVDVNVLVGRGSQPAQLTAMGNALFLLAQSPRGRGLYRIDGNQLTTHFLSPLAGEALPGRDMVASGSRLFFRALDEVARERTAGQLWVSDGTTPGTVPLVDLRRGLGDPHFAHLHAHAGGVVFAADDGTFGTEPWRSDGTAAGTGPASNVHSAPSARQLGSEPTFFLHTSELSVFDADDGERGREPWVTDTTAVGTRRLVDLVPGFAGSALVPLGATAAGALVASVRAVGGTSRCTYWNVGGPAGSTALPWPDPLGPPLATTVAADGDRAVVFAADAYAADGSVSGSWLLRTDGVTVQALMPRLPVAPRAVCVVAGVVFFAASAPGLGVELWTPAGLVRDLRAGPAGSDPGTDLGVALGARYVFAADDGIAGRELWRSDGTAAGTVRVSDLAVGGAGSNPRDGVAHDGVVDFVADVTGAGAELCRSDGTTAGTRLIVDLRPGPLGAQPRDLVAQAGGVYFTADDGVRGRRLWFSDGTAAGTRMVTGAADAPRALAALGARRLLFVASDAAEGDEAWITDGTATGTRRLAAVHPGPAGSDIARFDVRPDGRVLFVADDGAHGREPWAFDAGATAMPLGAGCGGVSLSLAASDPILGASVVFEGRTGAPPRLPAVLVLGHLRPALLGACRVYLDPGAAVLALAATAGVRRLALPVPNTSHLLGAVLLAQAALGPLALPPGLALSNAVVLRLGR